MKWMDSGFLVRLGKTTLSDTPNEVTFGPIWG